MYKSVSFILLTFLLIMGLSSCGTTRVAPVQKADDSGAGIQAEVVNTAYDYLGSRYRYGSTGPRSFDCSGLVYFIYNQHDVSLGRTTSQQAQSGRRISVKQAAPGDLVFFGKGRKMQHVGVVVSHQNGKLKMIHSSTSRGVVVEEVYSSPYWSQRLKFAVRVLG